MKVFIADREASERMHVGDLLLAESGFDVRIGRSLAASESEVIAEISDAEAVCVALGRISAKVMDQAPELRLIVKCGIGVDNIDVEAARSRGIMVLRTAGVNFRSVSEYVIGATIACFRQFVSMDRLVRNGRWSDLRVETTGLLPALTGRTLGVIGFGAIGREVARLAQAHGMRVIAYDPYLDFDSVASGVEQVGKSELLSQADVVSLHVLLTEETRHFLGKQEFDMMKRDAVLVNSSRGPVVDEKALAVALAGHQIRGAALDVMEIEPPVSENPLLRSDRCLLTPHLAGCTDYGYREIGERAVELVRQFARGEEVDRACVVTGG